MGNLVDKNAPTTTELVTPRLSLKPYTTIPPLIKTRFMKGIPKQKQEVNISSVNYVGNNDIPSSDMEDLVEKTSGLGIGSSKLAQVASVKINNITDNDVSKDVLLKILENRLSRRNKTTEQDVDSFKRSLHQDFLLLSSGLDDVDFHFKVLEVLAREISYGKNSIRFSNAARTGNYGRLGILARELSIHGKLLAILLKDESSQQKLHVLMQCQNVEQLNLLQLHLRALPGQEHVQPFLNCIDCILQNDQPMHVLNLIAALLLMADIKTNCDFTDAKSVQFSNQTFDLLETMKMFKPIVNPGGNEFTLQWARKILKGCRFRRVTAKLLISEEILNILPTSVVLFFSPLQGYNAKKIKPADWIDQAKNCLKNKCQITNCAKLMFSQLDVPEFNWNALVALAAETKFKFNIVVHNPQCIATLSNNDEVQNANLEGVNNLLSQFNDIQIDRDTLAIKEYPKPVVGIVDSGCTLDIPNQGFGSFEPQMKITIGGLRTGEYFDNDHEQHGSKVARILAQTCFPGTTIMVYQAFHSIRNEGISANYRDIANAFSSATERGVHYLNCSFNIVDDEDTRMVMERTIYELAAHRILPIFSAGNRNLPHLEFPATSPYCISVGAHRGDGVWSWHSSGKCAADIVTLDVGFQFGDNDKGTSFVTPIVTGFLTHLSSMCGNYYRDHHMIRTLLQGTAGNLSQCGSKKHEHVSCKKSLNVTRAYEEAKKKMQHGHITQVGQTAIDMPFMFNEGFQSERKSGFISNLLSPIRGLVRSITGFFRSG